MDEVGSTIPPTGSEGMRSLWLGILLATAIQCAAQGSWTTRHITSNEGLPQNSVQAMAMDSMEYLWLATDGGLVRYSGQEFKRFDLPGGGAPRSERMRSIVGSPDGEILVVDARGTVYMVHAHHLAFPVAQLSAQIRPHVGGYANMETFLLAADPARSFPGREGWTTDAVRMVPFNKQDWAAIGRSEVLFYRDSALSERIALPATTTFAFECAGALQVIDPSGLAYRAVPGDKGFSGPTEVMGWPRGVQRSTGDRLFWHAADGVPVLLLNGHFYLLRPLRQGRMPMLEPLPIQAPTSGHVTDALWNERLQMLIVATDIQGFFMYRHDPFQVRGIMDPSSMEKSVYYAQVPIGGDSVLAFTNSEIPVIVTDDTCFTTAPWLVDINKATGARLPQGGLVLGSDSALIAVDIRHHERRQLADCGDLITCIHAEGDTVWIGTLKTMGFFTDGRYQRIMDRPKRPESGIYSIRRLPEGDLLFGDCHGLFRVKHGPWSAESVPGSEDLCVRSLEVVDHELLVGTYGDGAYLLAGDSLRALPMDHNGFLAHAHGFMRDGTGHLWISTNHGLFRALWQSILDWKNDPTLRIPYEYFGARSGISNVEFNGGCDPPWVLLPTGTASFPTMGGLVQFDPEHVRSEIGSGFVLIESITADDLDIRTTGAKNLPADVQQITIGFSVSFWGDPVDLHIEYRLRETDEWRPMDPEQRSIVVPEPKPGRYEVEVRLVGAPIDSPQYHAIYFGVATPFYRTPWGIALALMLASVLVYLLIRGWSLRLERRNSALERAVDERTQSLHEANAELQRSVQLKERLISIVTHDIVSPLRFIAQVARRTRSTREGRTDDDLGALGDIHFAAEKLHSNAQNLLSWMKHQEGHIQPHPRHVVMSMLVDDLFDRVRPEAATKGLRLENDVQLDDVLMVDKDLLTIALNNLVMNAVTYTRKGVVRISAMTVENQYHVIVSDTGPGLSIQAREGIERIREGDHRTTSDEKGKGIGGLGYIIVHGIMDLLGGAFEVVGEDGPGTTIVLRLPMK